MQVKEYPISPPSLDALVGVLRPALEANYKSSSISVADCPDLRSAPFHLAAHGLSGRECVADIGGQPNLFPEPRLDTKWSMVNCARHMGMSQSKGMIIGAGAGPWFQIGMNSELAPNFGWKGAFDDVDNLTWYTKVEQASGNAVVERSPSTDCALMMNLYGSDGAAGPVIKVTAKGRKGEQKSFTECIRCALAKEYEEKQVVSMGGVFVIKAGKTNYHVMPDFPKKPEDREYTFKDPKELNDWLTYHDFDSSSASPIVCLTVFHSADPGKKMGLRMEHTHCFTTDGSHRGGHYHHDLEGDEVEYEAYLNTAKVIYRIDQPEVTLERDLHD